MQHQIWENVRVLLPGGVVKSLENSVVGKQPSTHFTLYVLGKKTRRNLVSAQPRVEAFVTGQTPGSNRDPHKITECEPFQTNNR